LVYSSQGFDLDQALAAARGRFPVMTARPSSEAGKLLRRIIED
jgi:hypothetical protein